MVDGTQPDASDGSDGHSEDHSRRTPHRPPEQQAEQHRHRVKFQRVAKEDGPAKSRGATTAPGHVGLGAHAGSRPLVGQPMRALKYVAGKGMGAERQKQCERDADAAECRVEDH